MVPGPGRDTHIGQIVLERHGRDHGLGAVASRGTERVGTARDRFDGLLVKVVVGTEHHRLDPPQARLLDQVELPDLPAARLRVHEQHRVPHRLDRNRLLDVGANADTAERCIEPSPPRRQRALRRPPRHEGRCASRAPPRTRSRR